MSKPLPTLTKLNQILHGDVVQAILTTPGLSLVTKNHCETYGKKTFAYFSVASMAERTRVEGLLKAAGCRVNDTYYPGHPMVEVQVSYLKARGWNR